MTFGDSRINVPLSEGVPTHSTVPSRGTSNLPLSRRRPRFDSWELTSSQGRFESVFVGEGPDGQRETLRDLGGSSFVQHEETP